MVSVTDLSGLSCGQLKELQKAVSVERKRRYPRCRGRRYGNNTRSFSDEQVERFFDQEMNEKARMAFEVMCGAGLRVNECAPLRVDQLNLVDGVLFLQTEKSDVFDHVPLFPDLLERLRSWCSRDDVVRSGYVFPSANPSYVRDHVSPHWLRREFRDVCERAGLNQVYGESVESYDDHKGRKLYLYTTHSLRHTFGYRTRRATGDLEITRNLMRHSSLESTQVYARASPDELRRAVRETFKNPQKLPRIAKLTFKRGRARVKVFAR